MGREMDWKLVEVLRRIEAGDTAFDPADTSKQAFQDFQPLACALVEAHRQGHVDGVMPIKESNGGKLEYRTVIVTGNLTHRGRQLLEKAQGQPTPTDRALNGAFGQLPGNRPGKSSSVAGSIVLRDCATMKLSPQCRSGTAGHHHPSQTRSKHFLVLSTIETLEIPFKRCWIT